MIPFSPPRIDEKIIAEVIDTLKSGWITTGPKTKLFEKQLALYCGNTSTLCVSSATAGLELVLRWFGVKEGDEVIVPAYTYAATANVVIHCGAKPVMVDVNKDDFNISVAAIINAVTSRTKVIIPVDFAGMPCDYDGIQKAITSPEISKLFNPQTDIQQQLGRMLILSDSAHSLGAKSKNKNAGVLADITVFSFHAVKNLTTAEGGAIALNLPKPFDNVDLYKHLNTNSLHGQNKDALDKTKSGNWRYDIISAGYKSNMSDLHASLGIVELARYNSETLPRRAAIFNMYTTVFSKFPWAQVPIYRTSDRISSFHVYALRIKGITEDIRDVIIQNIFDKGVSVNVHFQPLPLFTSFKNLGYNILDYPVSYDNYSREISLPVYFNLTDIQIQEVITTVSECVTEVLK